MDDAGILCGRCLTELTPGQGDFYVVHIEAAADPTPPSFDEDDLSRDVRSEIQHLLTQMDHLSPRELSDQVYRRVTIHLCARCFGPWIENPTG